MKNRRPEESLAETMSFLAESSRKTYQAFLQDNDFLTFYRQATPIDVLEISRIGSRPSRRTGRMTLDDLRAIPWVFSWTQARFYLPGWYGVGSALADLRNHRPEAHEEISRRYNEWPFLRYVFFNIESGLASANPDWIHRYSELVREEKARSRLRDRVLAEHRRTGDELSRILGSPLQQRRPRFYKTLLDREKGLDVLHEEQVRLLADWRDRGSDPQDERVPSLLLTVNAIASGLRTTG
jgi:phosphoenolpyruvate carboxylase